MKEKPDKFKKYVQKSLRHQVKAINQLASAGMIFWDYGNSFQYEASRAGNANPVKCLTFPRLNIAVFNHPRIVFVGAVTPDDSFFLVKQNVCVVLVIICW